MALGLTGNQNNILIDEMDFQCQVVTQMITKMLKDCNI